MKLLTVTRVFMLVLLAGSLQLHAAAVNSEIDWLDWSADLFDRARSEHRFVLLDLEAVWCHWCHVMDTKTYVDADVVELLETSYLAVKVDHDARPDLANRYRAWGWPATIIFDADGTEIIKRAGYIRPEAMARLMQAVIDDTSPERLARIDASLSAGPKVLPVELKAMLEKRHEVRYDPEFGGLNIARKFIDRDSIEYALRQGARGNQVEAFRAAQTLQAAMALIDQAWGGFYQYSTRGNWNNPHFEKIIRVQASYLRVYALAWAQSNNPLYQEAMLGIRRYMADFLSSPEGAFYVSQDADLVPGQHSDAYFALAGAERLKLGIPRVDKNRYAQENGWMIEALATQFTATGDHTALDTALRATDWVIVNRLLAEGGFTHSGNGDGSVFLGDNLAMARAFLALYRATADRKWLRWAQQVGLFIGQKFGYPASGFAGGTDNGSPIKPVPNIDENISLARFANLLAHYTGDSQYREMAQHALSYLAKREVATRRISEPGILLAADELGRDPLHLTIVGGKDDPAAQSMYATARRYPGWYKRLEWWDEADGPLPNPDVRYPQMKKAAAFVCTDKLCSLPVFDSQGLTGIIAEIWESRIKAPKNAP